MAFNNFRFQHQRLHPTRGGSLPSDVDGEKNKGALHRDDLSTLLSMFRTLKKLKLLRGYDYQYCDPRDTIEISEHRCIMAKYACYVTAVT